jgi:molybdopterin converting factor small subunit
LASARVWVNGDEPAQGDETILRDGDEVAVLPPVSGG